MGAVHEGGFATVMFGGRTAGVETALESMWELLMKENWPLCKFRSREKLERDFEQGRSNLWSL